MLGGSERAIFGWYWQRIQRGVVDVCLQYGVLHRSVDENNDYGYYKTVPTLRRYAFPTQDKI
jgi:hypothetical protein